MCEILYVFRQMTGSDNNTQAFFALWHSRIINGLCIDALLLQQAFCHFAAMQRSTYRYRGDMRRII